jgi:FecCD transport family
MSLLPSKASSCRYAGRASLLYWSEPRSRLPARIPRLVPQSAGISRYSRRLLGRGAWCRGRHLSFAWRPRQSSCGLHRPSGRGRCSPCYRLGGVRSRDPILVLVLTGVVIGSLFGAGVGLVKYLADPYNQLPAMTFWLLGSLSATTAPDLIPLLGPIAIGALAGTSHDFAARPRFSRFRSKADINAITEPDI